MNDYLFSQPALLIPTIICSVLCFLFFNNYRRFLRDKWRLAALGGITIALFTVEIATVRSAAGLDNTPGMAYFLVFVFDLVLVATILYIGSRHHNIPLGISAALCTLLLAALTINNFYQYYPTLGAIFGHSYSSTQQLVTATRTREEHLFGASIEANIFADQLRKGTLATVHIPGTRSGLHAREGYIYTPPAYSDTALASVQFPVLLLLTGTPGAPSNWLQSNIFLDTMNEFANQHHGITPIVAIVDHSGSLLNDTECLNSSHGNAETYLTVDVVNYLKAHYKVATSPDHWGIAGYSEGGMCAAMLTLTHQNEFRHFLDLSGDSHPYLNDRSQTLPVLFHGSRTAMAHHDIDWLLTNTPLSPDLSGQFAIGGSDSKILVEQMKYTYKLAGQKHMTSALEIMPNQGHTFKLWTQAYKDALPAMSYYLGASECQTGCVSTSKG